MRCCDGPPKFSIVAGEFVEWLAKFRNPDGTPVDFAGASFSAEIKADPSQSTPNAAWLVTLAAPGDLRLTLDTTATPLVPGVYRYVLWVTQSGGHRTAYFNDSILTVRP